ncbi:MAG: hypothetical protein AB1758_19180 [Candidatus Eremiobacterota bacterium]
MLTLPAGAVPAHPGPSLAPDVRALALVSSDQLWNGYRGLVEQEQLWDAIDPGLAMLATDACGQLSMRCLRVLAGVSAICGEASRQTAGAAQARSVIMGLKGQEREDLRNHLLYIGRQLRLHSVDLPSGVLRGELSPGTRAERVASLSRGARCVRGLIAPIEELVNPFPWRNLELMRWSQYEQDTLAWHRAEAKELFDREAQDRETGDALAPMWPFVEYKLRGDDLSEEDLSLGYAEVREARSCWTQAYGTLVQAATQAREELEQLWWHHPGQGDEAQTGQEWTCREALWARLTCPGD